MLLLSGRRRQPKRWGKQVPSWSSRSSFCPPVPLQMPLENRRYEALELDSKDEALAWGFPRGNQSTSENDISCM